MNVLYVSYDGTLDPLGISQVVRYLTRIASGGTRVSLISFEKGERWREVGPRRALGEELKRAGITWHPLAYHKRPRIPATALDVILGAAKIRRLARQAASSIIHCRGDVAMAMARLAVSRRPANLLYDVRGFFAAERVEAGSWKPDGVVDRLVRRTERANLMAASGLVVLTQAALAVLARNGPRLPPHRVIPTCVDTERFTPAPSSARCDYGLVYAGSLGGVTLAKEIGDFAAVAAPTIGRTLLLTPQARLAERFLRPGRWLDVVSARPDDVPTHIRRARAAVFFYKPGRGRAAQFPTKFAEALATGLPVVANRGIGDLDGIIERERVGVLVDDHGSESHAQAVRQLSILMEDVDLRSRCRRLAESRYSLAVGVSAYQELYTELGRGCHSHETPGEGC